MKPIFRLIGRQEIELIIFIILIISFVIWHPFISRIERGDIELFFSIVLAISTVGLFHATRVLARYTKAIDDREKKDKHDDDLRRCIFLAGEIISSYNTDKNANDYLRPFSELVTLGKYIHDAQTRKELSNFVKEELNVLKINVPTHSSAEAFNHTNLKEKLHIERYRWYSDLER
jgi:hypothetical protein